MSAARQSLYEVFPHQKEDLLLHLLSESLCESPVLVFVRNKETLHVLNTSASRQNLETENISGNKKPEVRDRALESLKESSIDVLFATESVLRESDLSGIATIIHFDVHEIDVDYLSHVESASSEVITFITRSDQNRLSSLENLVEGNLERCFAEDFTYDKQPRLFRTQPVKGKSNKTGSKPLQHKKPKLKNKGPRRKTGRTRKR
ncbi:helicase-related protein [bacterium]|nr:helicase-related protein [bacterium]